VGRTENFCMLNLVVRKVSLRRQKVNQEASNHNYGTKITMNMK